MFDPLLSRSHPDGIIRRLRPSERNRFRDHLLRLEPQGRRDRFVRAIADDFVIAYADRCFADGTTVLAYLLGDTMLGAAELHERVDFAEPTGEIAFSVEREWRRRGIGSALFGQLLDSARGLGYERLRITTHPQNIAARAMARKFGAHLHFADGDTVGQIVLPPLQGTSTPPGASIGWGK